MPNLAVVLKDEIRRLARKEVKAQTKVLRSAASQYRHDIAALKRQVRQQQKLIARLLEENNQRPGKSPAVQKPLGAVRFSPKSVKTQRTRLKLSAKDYGKLVGVSAMTIYNWEQGRSRPRKPQLAVLAALRGLGKREAAARLESLDAT